MLQQEQLREQVVIKPSRFERLWERMVSWLKNGDTSIW